MWRLNEERGTTVLEGGHIALFLLNIWYMVLPCPVAGWRFVEAGVPRRAIVFYYVPADWAPENWAS